MHYTEVYKSQTVDEELAFRLKAMPKIELHIHLEGAIDAATSFRMAQRNGISLPAASLEEWQQFYTFRDFNHFSEVYQFAAACLQTRQDYTAMVETYMRMQAEQHIVYSEVFLSTLLHLNKLPAEELLDALELGIKQGAAAFGTTVKLIPDISRRTTQRTPERQWDILNFAVAARDRGIGVGLGLGGTEIGYPAELYREVFAEARRQGLRVVAHGGETGGAVSVRNALDSILAERIGHGVQSLEDPILMAHLRDTQVPLEVSPHANYCLGVVRRDQPHPMRQLVDAGVYCTVNSDNPPFFSTDLTNEYLTLAAQGFTFDELWQLNLNGLEASFMSEGEKELYREVWEKWRKHSNMDTLTIY